MQRAFKNDEIRILKDWKPIQEVKFFNDITPVYTQTFPPSIPVEQQYTNGIYPIVHEVDYKQGGTTRRLDQEKKEMDVQMNIDINDCRKAAEVHRQTRRYIQEIIKPGIDIN